MQPISPNYNWETGVKQIKITEENLPQSCILCQMLMTKTLALGSNCFISAEWISGCDLFNMSSLSWISLMASLDILCSNLLNLKTIITKIEHKNIFLGPSKVLKYTSWPINICLNYFMTTTKTLRSPLLHT